MQEFSPHEVPYRRQVSPLGAYGRMVTGILLLTAIALLMYRRSFQLMVESVRWSRGEYWGTTREELIQQWAGQLYADDGVVVDFTELLVDILPTVYVGVPLLVTGVLTVYLFSERYR
jgi:hypothetical protein